MPVNKGAVSTLSLFAVMILIVIIIGIIAATRWVVPTEQPEAIAGRLATVLGFFINSMPGIESGTAKIRFDGNYKVEIVREKSGWFVLVTPTGSDVSAKVRIEGYEEEKVFDAPEYICVVKESGKQKIEVKEC